MTAPATLIVGLGHTGLRLAEALVARGAPVTGTVRTEARAREVALAGVDVRVASLEQPEALAGLCPPGGALVHTAPPLVGPSGEDEGARRLLEAVRPVKPSVLVYLSTTGVYAERDGGIVTEDSPLKPPSDPRAGPRLDAERAFLDTAAALGARGVVFRLSGIYGRGRGLSKRLVEGRVRLWGGGHNLLNRIHVDDIVAFILAALEGSAEGVFNLADDRPVSLREHALWLAERLGVPAPEDAPLCDAPSPTLVGSKRVSNARAKRTFGIELAYPSFVEGFEAR